jgi:PAS domain S-box-containing protein
LALLENNPVGVRISRDRDSKIVYANTRIVEMFGLTKEEFIGTRTEDHHADLGKHMSRLKRFRELGSLENEEVLMKRPDGSIFWVLMSVFRYEYENEPARLSWFYDITDRKEAEEAIQLAQKASAEAEATLKDAIENISDAFVLFDSDDRVVMCNEQFKNLYPAIADQIVPGISVEEIFDASAKAGMYGDVHDLKKLKETRLEAHRNPTGEEFLLHMDDGRVIQMKDSRTSSGGSVGIRSDVTQIKQAEEALFDSKAKLEEAQRIGRIGNWELDVRTGECIWSDEMFRIFNLKNQDSPFPREIFLNRVHPEDRELLESAPSRSHDEKEPYRVDYRIILPGGELRHVHSEGVTIFNEDDQPVRMVGIVQDITDGKEAEEELRKSEGELREHRDRLEEMVESRTASLAIANEHLARLNRARTAIGRCNHALVRTRNESDLTQEICRILVETGGYVMAWVGYAEHDENKSVRPVAWAGAEEGYLKGLNLTWADAGTGKGPMGTAIRTGEAVYVQDIRNEPSSLFSVEEALKRGYASIIGLPLNSDGEVIGALIIFGREPNAFDADELTLLQEMADDLSYGISSIRTLEKRRLAEEELSKSAQQFMEILENSPIGVQITRTEDSKILFANSSFLEMRQVTEAEYLGGDSRAHSSKFYVDPNHHKKMIARYNAEGFVRDFIVEMLRSDGSHCWALLFLFPIEYEGEPARIAWIYDFTERKNAEEAVAKLNRDLQMISSCNRAMIHTAGERELLNEVCRIVVEDGGHPLAWVGYLVDEKDQTMRAVANAGGREDYISQAIQRFKSGIGLAVQTIRTGKPIVVQDIHTDPRIEETRETRIIQGFGSFIMLPLIANGKPFGVLYIYSEEANAFDSAEVELLEELAGDLSYGIAAIRTREEKTRAEGALLVSEERTRTIVDSAYDGIISIDEQGTIESMNLAALKIFGYSSEEILGENVKKLMPESYREPHTVGLTRYLDTGRGKTMGIDTEIEGLRKDGTEFPMTIVRNETQGGDRRILFGTVRDITERKRAEEELKRTQEMVIRSEKLSSIGTLTAGAAHEILNPANIIGMHAQRLLRSSEEESREYKTAEVICRNVDRIQSICDDLRRFSRDEKPRFAPFDPDKVVQDSINLVLHELRLVSVRHFLELGGGDLRVIGDHNQIQQVFFNLIGNARDAMPSGGGN